MTDQPTPQTDADLISHRGPATLDPRDADPFRAEGTDDEPETPGDWDGRLAAFLLGTIVAFGLVIAFGARA